MRDPADLLFQILQSHCLQFVQQPSAIQMAAALRGLRVPAGSPKSLRRFGGPSSRPYLQGCVSLEDLQGKLPGAKSETWGPYQKTVDEIGDTPVTAGRGRAEPTTIKGFWSPSAGNCAALNRGLKTGNPESMQLSERNESG